jgi:hypothetical protein
VAVLCRMNPPLPPPLPHTHFLLKKNAHTHKNDNCDERTYRLCTG